MSHVQAKREERGERNGARSEEAVSREGREKETKAKGKEVMGMGRGREPYVCAWLS